MNMTVSNDLCTTLVRLDIITLNPWAWSRNYHSINMRRHATLRNLNI